MQNDTSTITVKWNATLHNSHHDHYHTFHIHRFIILQSHHRLCSSKTDPWTFVQAIRKAIQIHHENVHHHQSMDTTSYRHERHLDTLYSLTPLLNAWRHRSMSQMSPPVHRQQLGQYAQKLLWSLRGLHTGIVLTVQLYNNLWYRNNKHSKILSC